VACFLSPSIRNSSYNSARRRPSTFIGGFTLMPNPCPKLRATLDIRPLEQNGQRLLLLRDPGQISDAMLGIPQALAPVLLLCDGQWDAESIAIICAEQFHIRFEDGVLEGMIEALDEALFLDNARFAQAKQRALDEYRAAPFRPPMLAGASYPENPDELRQRLEGHLAEAGDVTPTPAQARGLVSPHIDYMRGHAVYAKVWKRAAESVKAADLIIMLGTDHYSDEAGSLTLTRQHYATPYGILPTARGIVDKLADAIGPEGAYRGELRHRGEHSLELVAVWLHHLRAGKPVEMVPILTGSFGHFVKEGASPLTDPKMRALLDMLKRETQGRRALVVASGDLAHVGPAFEGDPLDVAAKATLAAEDDGVIKRMCVGDADSFYWVVQRLGNRNNVCGLSPVYLTLKLLGNAEGERVAYAMCPADEQNTSAVTVCGVVLE